MKSDAIKTFVLAGHAVFTLTSTRTGTSFTYKISEGRPAPDGGRGPLFAAVLTGPDNQRDYTYMGVLRNGLLHSTKGSKVFGDAPSYKALVWFLANIGDPRVEFRHVGRCGRCGRALTVPSSIDSGLGPECASKVGQ